MDGFDAAYERLNEGQKQAVDTIEGPVMVVAGPGTGKTQTLALRVASILRRTQMRPGNILCLTFSVSGATAMRERLRELIGADAYGVTVRNFHGFCNDLIGQHPHVFESLAALEQISEVERFREVNKIIDQLMPDFRLVSRKTPYDRTGKILQRISELKREGKTDRDTLLGIADEYDAEMSGKSKEGTKAHEENLLRARKFRDFLEVFFRYQEMLTHTGRYDFEDMILTVTAALRENESLLQGLQERFMYVLVDEFQDTNGAQYDLVEVLTTYPTLDHEPNLFVVGDDDQAIYRFQGANLQNILRFHDRFPKAPVIPLTVSYRCHQSILNAANTLIEHNTERLTGRIDELDKKLKSSKQEKGIEPSLVFSPSDATEPWLVADIIDEKLREGIAPAEIAILVQTNKEVLQYYDVLNARGIDVDISGKADLLSSPLVRQALSLLRAVHEPSDDSALAAALACECLGCHPADIGRILWLRRVRSLSLRNLLLLLNDNGTWNLDDPDGTLSRFTVLHPAHVVKARDFILKENQNLENQTVVHTMEHILKDSGLVPTITDVTADTVDPMRFAVLQEFFDRIRMRAYEQPTFAFESFISDLTYYENPEYGELRLSYTLPHLTDEGVRLMTAHQSKGLEFDVVVLPNFCDGHWDRRKNISGVSLPEDLLFGWNDDQKKFERNQDERRVAFVAMTRAKSELIFTCPRTLTKGNKARDVSPSAFFAESGKLPEQERELLHPEHAALLLFEPTRDMDEEYKAFLRERIAHFSLSVTALNHFLEDPKIFVERDLLQMPEAKSSDLIYGNAVHDALRTWATKRKFGEECTEHHFIERFRAYLDEREVLTDAERTRLKAQGEQDLPRYFEACLKTHALPIWAMEYKIQAHLHPSKGSSEESIPLKGTMDRIDLLASQGSDAVITDYKTGSSKTEKEIRDGGYHRQLVFYALLIEEGGLPINPTQYVLDFVGHDLERPIKRAFVVSQQDKEELREVIRAVWKKIKNLDFTSIEATS